MPPRRKNAKGRVSRKQAPSETNQPEVPPEEKEMEVDANPVEETVIPSAPAPAPAPVPEAAVAEEEEEREAIEDEEAQESNGQQTMSNEDRTEKLKLLRQRMVCNSCFESDAQI